MKDCFHRARVAISAAPTSERQTIMALWDAHRGFDYTVRLQGQNLDYEVVCTGVCGEEVIATGTLALGTVDNVSVRTTGTWGDTQLLVRGRQVTASATRSAAEVTANWRQVRPGVSPTFGPNGGG